MCAALYHLFTSHQQSSIKNQLSKLFCKGNITSMRSNGRKMIVFCFILSLAASQISSRIIARSARKSIRRTFFTALLAAEVTYLEKILRSQLRSKRPRYKERPNTPRKPATHWRQPVIQNPHQVKVTTSSPPISQLDPFYILEAPDLSPKVLQNF